MELWKVLVVTFIIIFISAAASAIVSVTVTPSSIPNGGSVSCTSDLELGNTERNLAFNMTFYNGTSQALQITGCTYTGTTQNIPNQEYAITCKLLHTDFGDHTETASDTFTATGGSLMQESLGGELITLGRPCLSDSQCLNGEKCVDFSCRQVVGGEETTSKIPYIIAVILLIVGVIYSGTRLKKV